MGALQQTKTRLRQEMLARRQALTEEEIARRSAVIQAGLLAHPGYQRACVVGLYIGVRGEVRTDRLIEEGGRTGRRWAAPVADHERFLLRFAEVRDRCRDLRRARFGLLEPDLDRCPLVEPAELDCLVTPGVAFDRQGFRLGYGRGFYDRFLPQLRSDCLRVGLAYDFQLVERLPVAGHDVRLDLLIAETDRLEFEREP